MQTKLFIGGGFHAALDDATVDVLDPHDCTVLALAAGNTVVMKPSELTPMTSLRLAEPVWHPR